MIMLYARLNASQVYPRSLRFYQDRLGWHALFIKLELYQNASG